jgi:NADPH:quinone reductase-like Zn-dependent oxidoreductase
MRNRYALLAVTATVTASAPTRMRAFVATEEVCRLGSALNFSALRTAPDHELPRAKHGQAIIKVASSSINPCDVDIIIHGGVQCDAAALLHKTLGFDVAGTVLSCDGCSRLKVGDEVWTDKGEFGIGKGIVQMGAFAEYAVADEVQVGLKPQTLDMSPAGVVPLVGLTNLEAFDKVSPSCCVSKRVLITSGSGGTGHLAVQMAKAMGATSIAAVTSTANVPYVRSLGADVVIDYKKQNWWDVVPDNSLDLVYDNLGFAGSSDHAMDKLRFGGTLVIIQGDLSKHPKPGVAQYRFTLGETNSTYVHYHNLDRLRSLVDAGQLKPRVQQAIALEDIGRAYALSHSGHVVGKVAVVMNATMARPPPPPQPRAGPRVL